MHRLFPARSIPAQLVLLITLFLAPFLTPVTGSARILQFVERNVAAPPFDAKSLVISEDGRYLYTGGYAGMHQFRRDASTGELTFVEIGPNADSIAISPDGRSLYAGTSSQGSVRVLRRDTETGALTSLETWQRVGLEAFSPTAIAASRDGRHLYATDDGTLVVFGRDAGTGVLTWVGSLYEGLELQGGLGRPEHLALSPDGAHVYVVDASFDTGGAISALSRDADSGRLSLVQTLTANADLPSLADPHFARVSRDGHQVYVATSQGLVVLARNPADGSLALSQVVGGGGQGLAESLDGRFLYVVRESVIEIFSRDLDSGLVLLVETHSIGIETFDQAETIEISPDGQHLYVASPNDFHGSNGSGLVAFSCDPGTGRLDFVAAYLDEVEGDAEGISNPRVAVASPDGKNVYVLTWHYLASGEIAAFSSSPGAGELDFAAVYDESAGFEGLVETEGMAISPDGRNLYVTGRTPADSLVVITRNEETGALDPLETHYGGSGGPNGLRGAHGVTVSPDGRHVYTTGKIDNAVSVFARDPASGRLTFVNAYFDGVAGVQGLGRAYSVAVSPSGEHVYVHGPGDLAVAAFHRDAVTGELEFLDMTFDHSLANGSSGDTIVASQDGRNLYVTAGNRLVVLNRAPATGRTSFLESHAGSHNQPILSLDGKYVFDFTAQATVYRRDQSTGALQRIESHTLPFGSNARASVQSPDGEFFYVSATSDSDTDAVLVFHKKVGVCREGFDGLCLRNDRFRVELDWRDFAGNTGSGHLVPDGSDDSAIFWFFGEDNWEMQLKILNACGLNDRFWVFAAATTNVEYTLHVTDVLTGASKTYFNPLGHAAAAITDTDAFATCSGSNAAEDAFARDTQARADNFVAASGDGQPVVRSAWKAHAPDKSDGSSLLVGLDDKCLDIEGGDSSDGTPAVLFDCHRRTNQRWYRIDECHYFCDPDFELQGLDGKCLQPGPESVSGHRQLVVGPCDGTEDRWEAVGHLPEQFSLVHMDTGLCADVLGGSSDNRTPIVLFPCHGGANQLWSLEGIRCDSSPTGLCKSDERFLVEIEWRDFEGKTGLGRVVPSESDDSGLFWFFGPDNWEMLVKVLDRCDHNDRFWVFAAGTTNVEYTLRVTDTETGEVREYFNPLGNAAPAITDTSAFATCSGS